MFPLYDTKVRIVKVGDTEVRIPDPIMEALPLGSVPAIGKPWIPEPIIWWPEFNVALTRKIYAGVRRVSAEIFQWGAMRRLVRGDWYQGSRWEFDPYDSVIEALEYQGLLPRLPVPSRPICGRWSGSDN